MKREGWVPLWVTRKKVFLPVEKPGVAGITKTATGGLA